MLFPTLEFAVFFAVVFTLNGMLRRRPGTWKAFMLGASYFFYGFWDWRFVFLLLGSSLVNQAVAVTMHRLERAASRRRLLALAVTLNLLPLAYFKYAQFGARQALWVWVRLGLDLEGWFPVLDALDRVILPVGISFFTFQALTYVIDVYRRLMPPTERWIDFALYLAFFPQLVAGPIVRARDLVPQLQRLAVPVSLDTGRAAGLILGGLFKKIVIANALASLIVDPVFGNPQLYGAWDTLFAVYAYAIQIYCDFSAYSDIAIGICLLMGITLPLNFDAPYLAGSIQSFWRRWHISLSFFLRDYLYIPLGGSRGTMLSVYRNLMITFLLGGLWHGAGWTFIIWGGLHGLYLCFERRIGAGRDTENTGSWARQAGRRVLVWHLVCFSWLFFRGESFAHALEMIRALARWGQPATLLTLPVAGAIMVGYASQWLDGDRLERGWNAFARLPGWVQGAVAAVILTVILALGPEGVAPFIYFQF